jgi:PiT family inorganic phosphate transporter
MVPVLIGLMAFAFSTYLVLKGLNKICQGRCADRPGHRRDCSACWPGAARAWVAAAPCRLSNTKDSINALFTLPLICAAALLSFAHGANDVANAVGPAGGHRRHRAQRGGGGRRRSRCG